MLTISLLFQSNHPVKKLFTQQQVIATIDDGRLIEASGLEESYENPGYFWTHNDSGGEPVLYLIDTKGKVQMEVELEGMTNRDWEEIVTAKHGEQSYIYVAETGDNKAVHENVSLIRLPEPKFSGSFDFQVANQDLDIMTFTYAEGARDAEALLFDSQFNEFVLVTKREKHSMVYAFPFEISNEPISITSHGTIPSRNFTAADLNEDGEILLKNYDSIYFWGGAKTRALYRILTWNALAIDYSPEPQGEAICWYKENFYTISEKNPGKPQEMLLFERLK